MYNPCVDDKSLLTKDVGCEEGGGGRIYLKLVTLNIAGLIYGWSKV